MEIVKIQGNATGLAICHHIRHQVFVIGQNIPEDLEIDGLDPEATHYLVYVNEIPIGTARVRLVKPDQAKIERVAILEPYRGQGYGSELINFMIADLQQQENLSIILLGAQLTAIRFYEKLGFTAFGEVFLDAGIEHRWLSRLLVRENML